jgi:hypothetical protein
MPPHIPYGLRGLPSRLWPSVTDFWGWDAHEAQLRCPDEVDGDIWIRSTRRGLNLSSTKLSRPWSPWKSSHLRKIFHGRTGNRTRDLMISSQKLWPLDHEAGRVDFFSLFAAQRGLWPPRSRGFVVTHNDAPRSVGLFWMSDHLVAETSTW